MKNKWILLSVLCLFLLSEPVLAQSSEPDFGNVEHYEKDNLALGAPRKGEKRVIFFGNSITEVWQNADPEFFKERGFIGRGISGQSTYEFLLRFHKDVVDLKPALVIIEGGGNDIAENSMKYNPELTMDNIKSMVDMAKANKIKVILTSLLPFESFFWNTDLPNVPEKTAKLNEMIQQFAKANKIPFADYYSAMLSEKGSGIKPAYTYDGVHPTKQGSKVMESVVLPIINKTL